MAALVACTAMAGIPNAAVARRDGCGFHVGPCGRCIVNHAGGFYRGYGY